MRIRRNRFLFKSFLILWVMVGSLAAYGQEINIGILNSLQNIEELQTEYINSCDNNSERYNLADDINRIALLCVRSYLRALKSKIQVLPPVDVFHQRRRPYMMDVSAHDTNNQRRLYEERIKAWIREYPFSELDEKFNIGAQLLLTQDHLLIQYDCLQKGLSLNVYLSIVAKSGTLVIRQQVDYSFRLAFGEDQCDKAKYQEALITYVDEVKENPYLIISEEGILLEDYENSFGWRLVSVDVSPCQTREYRSLEITEENLFGVWGSKN